MHHVKPDYRPSCLEAIQFATTMLEEFEIKPFLVEWLSGANMAPWYAAAQEDGRNALDTLIPPH